MASMLWLDLLFLVSHVGRGVKPDIDLIEDVEVSCLGTLRWHCIRVVSGKRMYGFRKMSFGVGERRTLTSDRPSNDSVRSLVSTCSHLLIYEGEETGVHSIDTPSKVHRSVFMGYPNSKSTVINAGQVIVWDITEVRQNEWVEKCPRRTLVEGLFDEREFRN